MDKQQQQPQVPEILEALAKGIDFEDFISDVIKGQCNSKKPKPQGVKPPPKTVNDLIGDLFGKHQPHVDAPPPLCNLLNKLVSPQPESVSTFDYEISETDDTILVYVDMPGVDKSSIRVSYESVSEDGKKTLNITSDRLHPCPTSVTVKSTTKYGKKALSLLLKKAPQYITSEDIFAKFENGVLHITVPRERKTASKEPNYVHIA